MEREAERSLRRLWPRLEATFAGERRTDPDGWAAFNDRLDRHFPPLFDALLQVYGSRYDFFYHLERILEVAARSWLDRPADLRRLDASREADPGWFQAHTMMGAVCYVDRYAGTLAGLRERIPYVRELGLTYLHLMPLFKAPAGNSDGGYAVSSYREVNPSLGTMAELAELARELRKEGISLVLDFVFNHTSDEHAWAVEARAHPDDEEHNTYLMFPDRTIPDAYDRTLREIFPDQRPGSFTWVPEIERWVWTTFNSFQWDLNYANPLVFERMAAEMLFLANQGVEILRLDAVAFIWKQLGTASESLPEAHLLVRAFNALARIAAPALLFKSEAIVHPAEVATYISPAECQLSYNPLLMALLWETLATRRVELLLRSMRNWFAVPAGTTWINYVRSHDDIGWTFDDADAAALGISGFDHRRFLNRFYTGRFPGTFARGVPFQENPRTGDARISGTAASLAGLEKALLEEGPAEIQLSIDRLLVISGITLAIGGVPLLYLGDELATLNDRSYLDDPTLAGDSRWIHRPAFDSARWARRRNASTPEGRMFTGLQRLITARKRSPGLGGSETRFLDTGSPHVFAFTRGESHNRILVIANMTDSTQSIVATVVDAEFGPTDLVDAVTEALLFLPERLELAPYQMLWLASVHPSA